MKAKQNARRVPVNRADLDKAKREAMQEATWYAMTIMLMVLVDKFNAAEYIADVWREVNSMAESVVKGYVTIPEMKKTLKKEYGITVE